MAIDPVAIKAAALTTLSSKLAAAVTPGADFQDAIASAIADAIVAMVPMLQVLNPLGLVAPPPSGPITGATAPGGIG